VWPLDIGAEQLEVLAEALLDRLEPGPHGVSPGMDAAQLELPL
jgi:hypothetical protein